MGSIRGLWLNQQIELKRHRAIHQRQHSPQISKVTGAPTETLPSTSTSSSSQDIYIPPSLLPIFALLQSHIAELTRDNAALRYTFMGNGGGREGGMAVPGTDAGAVAPAVESAGDRQSDSGPAAAIADVDLEQVVGRVRELVKENEELGEMVLRVGRAGAGEWQAALDGMSGISLHTALTTILRVSVTTITCVLPWAYACL